MLDRGYALLKAQGRPPGGESADHVTVSRGRSVLTQMRTEPPVSRRTMTEPGGRPLRSVTRTPTVAPKSLNVGPSSRVVQACGRSRAGGSTRGPRRPVVRNATHCPCETPDGAVATTANSKEVAAGSAAKGQVMEETGADAASVGGTAGTVTGGAVDPLGRTMQVTFVGSVVAAMTSPLPTACARRIAEAASVVASGGAATRLATDDGVGAGFDAGGAVPPPESAAVVKDCTELLVVPWLFVAEASNQ